MTPIVKVSRIVLSALFPSRLPAARDGLEANFAKSIGTRWRLEIDSLLFSV